MVYGKYIHLATKKLVNYCIRIGTNRASTNGILPFALAGESFEWDKYCTHTYPSN
jgi:hypothetical protein